MAWNENIDLGIFVGAAIFLLLFERSIAFRLVGYALALILGLAKWYPMTILTLAPRERLGIFLATAAISLSAFALFVVGTFDQVKAVIKNVPRPDIYTTFDYFGVTALVQLVQDVGRHAVTTDFPARGLQFGLCLGSFALASLLAVGLSTLRGINKLKARPLNCLLVGCLLFAGCYLT